MVASAFAMVVFGAGVAVPAVCRRAYADELGLDFGQRGLLDSGRMAALLASLLLVGHLAGRWGMGRFLMAGLVTIALSQMAAARATGYRLLLTAQVFAGVGKGAMEALVNPLVALLNPASAPRVLNVINGLFSVGLVVAALSTGEILEAGGSWRVPFWIWVLPALVCAGLFATRCYPRAPREQTDRRLGFPPSPLFWLLFAAMAMGGGCEAGLTAWGPNYVEHELGASPRGGAWVIVLYGTFMAAGRFATGGLVARVTPVRLMRVSAALCAAATLGLCLAPGLWAAWALFALGGLSVACFWPTLLSVASDHIAAGSARLFALLSAAGIAGCAVFPWAIGALGDAYSLRAGLLLLPVSMAAQIAILTAVGRSISHHQDE